jgi:hypothetical protein
MSKNTLIKPLDDHSEMYVTVSRSKIHPPCYGLVRLFDTEITADEFAEHTLALAHNPHGLGRRVEKPRLPGARARWVPSPIPPSIRMETEPHDPAQLSRLIDAVASQRPDPARDAGWRHVSAATDDGGTMVITWMNHAFGDARSLFHTILGDHADVRGMNAVMEQVGSPSDAIERPLWSSTRDELGDVMSRVRRGLQGSARLGRDVMLSPLGTGRREELALLGPAARAMRPRPRSVGTLSSRRTATMARIDHDLWRRTARAHGGSSNTLFIAILANLLRQARRARGEAPLDRLRILMPVDIAMALDAMNVPIEERPTTTVIASLIDLPGDLYYGDLGLVKDSIKQAIDTAIADASATGNSTRPAGIVDAMSLMPNAITHRIAARVQTGFDGVASNVGEMFIQEKAGIAEHTPTEMYMLAAPMRTDISGVFAFYDGTLTLSFMADPSKLGPGGAFADRVATELERWDVTGDVW